MSVSRTKLSLVYLLSLFTSALCALYFAAAGSGMYAGEFSCGELRSSGNDDEVLFLFGAGLLLPFLIRAALLSRTATLVEMAVFAVIALLFLWTTIGFEDCGSVFEMMAYRGQTSLILTYLGLFVAAFVLISLRAGSKRCSARQE